MDKETAISFKRLWHLIAIHKLDIRALYMHTILGALIQLSLPLGIQSIISFSQGATMVTSIYVLVVLIVLGVTMVGVMQILQMRIIEKIQQKIFVHYAFEFAEKIPRFDLLEKDNYYLPEKTNCFLDTAIIQKGLSKLLLDVPTAVFQIIVSLILLSIYSSMFIIIGFLLLLIVWIIIKATVGKGISTSFAESKYKYNVVGWLEEIARTIKSFKYSQGSHLNLKKTDEQVLGYINSRTAHFKVLLTQYKSIVIFKTIITASMLIIGVYLLINQQINIGEFIASEIVILTIIAAIEKLIVSLENVYDVLVGLEKLETVTESKLDADGSIDLPKNNQGLSIQFNNVSFAYPTGKNIIHNFSVTIAQNSKVAIVGNESSGKSTLLKLITGNYNHFSGQITINQIPIQNYQLISLRSQMGIFLNEIDIFSGTLLENITMGKTSIDEQSIVELANSLGFPNFLIDYHLGFDTVLQPIGNQLSSSKRKCILLLRAFINKPSLLLLDEPWLGLEEPIQQQIKNYILYQLPNSTVIVKTNDALFIEACQQQLSIKL